MYRRKKYLLLLLVLMGAIRQFDSAEQAAFGRTSKKTLHLMYIYYSPMGVHLRSIIDFAAEVINNRSDILAGYDLRVHGNLVGRQDIGHAMKAFIDMVSTPPTKIAILGPTFTSQARVVADVASHYSLLEMAHSVTSPLLSNKALYPYFGRTAHTTALHNPAIIQILKHYNWRKVAKLVKDFEYVVPTAIEFQEMLDSDSFNFTTLATTTYATDPISQLKQIKASGAKIVILFNSGVEIYCRLYEAGLYGAHYQVIIWSGAHGLGDPRYVSPGAKSHGSCSQEQNIEAKEGILYIKPVENIADKTENPSAYGITEFQSDYLEWLLRKNLSTISHMHYGAGVMVDAVTAIALALNNSQDALPPNYTLDQFNYGDVQAAELFFTKLTELQFIGLTGELAFDKQGDRISKLVISQFQGGIGVRVATYDPKSAHLSWSEENSIRFAGGHPPTDSDIFVASYIRTDPKIYYTVCVFASLGLVYCCMCLMFSLKYGDTRLVKMSSPRINSLIAFGCALSYVSVILMGIDSVTSIGGSVLCNVRVWALVFGFTFAFGSLFSKTFRVHVLFTNKKLTRKVVKDRHLYAIVLAVAAIDAIYLTIWAVVDPLRKMTIDLPDVFDPTQDGIVTQPSVDICTSNFTVYWTGPIYGFKALLLIFGIFFAWETRKVQIEALNDSKQVGICVYNVTVMSVIAVPMINLLSVQQVDISFGVAAIAVLLCSTMTLLLVYGQKMFLVATKSSQVSDMHVLPFAASLRDGANAAGPTGSGTGTGTGSRSGGHPSGGASAPK